MKPTPGYVMAEPIEDEQQSGDIYLPESSKDKPATARVLAVGENTEGKRTTIKVGQTIIHKRWQPTTINHNGKELVFVAFEDILGYDE